MGLVQAPLQADSERRADAGSGDDRVAVRSRARGGLLATAAVLLALVLWGGYSHHWPWTGIDGGTATLWDRLHPLLLALLLPTVVVPASMPIGRASGSAVAARQSAASSTEGAGAGSTPAPVEAQPPAPASQTPGQVPAADGPPARMVVRLRRAGHAVDNLRP